MEFISDRVSVEERKDGLSVVISARLPRFKETLLVAWFAAWTFCGVYFIWSAAQTDNADLRRGLIAMIAFWIWYEWRIGRVMLWRLKGFEIWRCKGSTFTIKDSVFGYGRANDYFVDNIQRLGLLAINELDWKWQLNDSFWVKGAERLGFEHLNRKIVLGKGLTKEEAERLLVVLSRTFKKARKADQ